MKSSKLILPGLILTGLAVLPACSKQPERAKVDSDKTTPAVSETERPGTSSPSDISAITAQARVSDLKVGPRLDASGAVSENVDELLPGEPVLASIAVGDIGAGSEVKAVWFGPDDARIAEEVKPVNAGAAFLVFSAPDTGAWKPGDYKVEIYLGDELASSESFDIVDRKPA